MVDSLCVFRTELLKLLVTCFSEAMYLSPSSESQVLNPWVSFFCSAENRLARHTKTTSRYPMHKSAHFEYFLFVLFNWTPQDEGFFLFFTLLHFFAGTFQKAKKPKELQITKGKIVFSSFLFVGCYAWNACLRSPQCGSMLLRPVDWDFLSKTFIFFCCIQWQPCNPPMTCHLWISSVYRCSFINTKL